jgi:TonB-dependent receptor
MTSKFARTSLMATAALSTLLFATGANAQTSRATTTAATSAAGASREAETIVVRASRPIAESDRAALLVQRASPSLVSVLSADEAGRLADQNIAFAVGRLPGVGVQRDQGQARYINLRGLPNRYVTISFDGLNIVSPEGRATRFDNIPSAIASQVVVSKAITADMPSDTVAGNVDIKTRSAFDYRGRKVTGGVQLGIVEYGGGEEIDASLVVSDRFMDDKIGLLAQASYYRRRMITDNFETDPMLRPGGVLSTARYTPTGGVSTACSGVTPVPAACFSGSPDRRPGSETRSWAREYENKPYRLTRGNISGSLRADWRPNDMDKMFVQTVYTQYTDDELRTNHIFRFDNGATNVTGACPAVRAPITGTGAYDICNGNTPEKGTVYGTQITGNFNSLNSKEYIFTSTVGGDHKRFGWDMAWRLNITETEDGGNAGATPNFTSSADPRLRPTVEYDFTNPEFNTVRLYTTIVDPVTGVRSRGPRQISIEAFPLAFNNISFRTDSGDFTQAFTGRFDAKRDFEVFGLETNFKTGFAYTTRSKKTRSKVWTATDANLLAAGRALPTYGDFALDRPFLGEMTLGYSFRYHSQGRLEEYVQELISSNIARRIDQTDSYFNVTEEIIAGYAMANFNFDWGSLVLGLRAEQTTNTGESFNTIGGRLGLTTVSSDDIIIYPSAHLNWDVRENVKLRLGFTTGAARPEFTTIRPNFSINDTAKTISGGNPIAQPERAVGVDAYLEYYIQPEGYFSIGVFHKQLSDVLFTQIQPFGITTLDAPGFERSTYDFTSVQNAGDGEISGFEIAYNHSAEQLVEAMNAPEWLGGFGIRATATWTDSEVTVPETFALINGVRTSTHPERKTGLPGASDFLYNLSLVYEKYGLSTRIAYQFRKAWQNGIGTYLITNGVSVPDGNGDNYWEDDAELDISVRYEINKNITITFDAANVTDEAGIRSGDRNLVGNARLEWEKYGPRYLLGARFNF